jgi:hypothetical protein
MKSATELASCGDTADGGAYWLESEEIYGTLLGVVELKVMERVEVGVLAGLFGGLPVLGVSASGCKQDEREPTEPPHCLTF